MHGVPGWYYERLVAILHLSCVMANVPCQAATSWNKMEAGAADRRATRSQCALVRFRLTLLRLTRSRIEMERIHGDKDEVRHEVRQRIVRPATPEEKERQARIREAIKEELPELKQWAREAAARHVERVRVGTVFGEEEAAIVQAIDRYAAGHALGNRGAVVREALSQLLRIEIPHAQS